MNFEINDEAWAKELESGVSEYIDTLIYGTYSEDGEAPETESGLEFCGCDVCYWREVLTYVTGRILEGQASGKIALIQDV